MRTTKLKVDLLLPVILLIASSAGANVPKEIGFRETKLVSGEEFTCALYAGAVYCWGEKSEIKDVPPLQNPTLIAAGPYNACALHNGGAACWGYRSNRVNDVPPLRNPRQITVGTSNACALDDDGVKCWGSSVWVRNTTIDLRNVPPLSNPSRVVAIGLRACALHNRDEVKCWGETDGDSFKDLLTKSDYQFSQGQWHYCELQSGRTWCEKSFYGAKLEVPALKTPTQLTGGFWHNCVLDQEQVRCWGYDSRNGSEENWTKIPDFDLPLQVSAGGEHTCAVDLNGVQCWGAYKEVPSIFVPTPRVHLETMPRFLYRLASDMTRAQGIFVKAVADGIARVEKAFPTQKTSWTRILALNLLSPFVDDLSSVALEQTTKPLFAHGLQASNQHYGVTLSRGALQGVPRSQESIQMALELIQAALQSLSLYTATEADRFALQEAIQRVRKAIADKPVNAEAAELRAIYEWNDRNSKLTERMRTSFQVRGVTLSLDAAVAFLRDGSSNE